LAEPVLRAEYPPCGRLRTRAWVMADDGGSRVGRNQPCPCGSGRKAKRCCGPARRGSGADATEFVARLASGRAATLESLCEECQTAAWMGVMDLPDRDPSCALRLPLALPPALRELQVALVDDDKDAVADCLVAALAVVDTAVVRAELAAAVSVLEVQGRCRPRVAAAALVDLAGPTPSMFVLAAMLKAVGDAAGVRTAAAGLVGAIG
jgi:hypothetical protein